MDDRDIQHRIGELIDEEHRLRSGASGDPVDRDRLARIEETLDQYWDLLRQRRGRHEWGKDTAAAGLRDVETVENYEQ